MNRKLFKYLIASLLLATACSKSGDAPSDGGNNGGGTDSGDDKTNCILSTISQVNGGPNTESSLSAFYNSNFDVTKLVIYDSAANSKSFEAGFNYITTDSIRISPNQYFIRDANKRIIRFFTKSDMANPNNADDYLFIYNYNDKGFLATKELYINGSPTANFKTVYTYSNNMLTSCLMTAVSSGNLKVLEANFVYDNKTTIKNWIYTFPDATEAYMYLTVFNFGNRPSYLVKQIVTRIYNPVSGSLLDTWTTNYENYVIDKKGYVLSAEANGDLQQGIASFYGKTNFYYDCH